MIMIMMIMIRTTKNDNNTIIRIQKMIPFILLEPRSNNDDE